MPCSYYRYVNINRDGFLYGISYRNTSYWMLYGLFYEITLVQQVGTEMAYSVRVDDGELNMSRL